MYMHSLFARKILYCYHLKIQRATTCERATTSRSIKFKFPDSTGIFAQKCENKITM